STLLRGFLAAAMVAALHGSAFAEGAIAIGASGDFAKDGFAFGAAIDKTNVEAASDTALTTCRKYEGAPKMAKICRGVFTFSRECYALSYAPKPGTPGVGWAIASDKPTAEDRAQRNCEATAGADRRGTCKINQSFCDTHD